MTITPSQIKWSAYSVYEGPFFIAGPRFKLPATPTDNDRILAVITATEGGSWAAINMYDRCICTVGLIQWCEAGQFSVSDMLGYTFEREPILLDPLALAMAQSGVTLRKNARGRWRFFFEDARGEVDRRDEQQQLFLACDGRKGSWTAEAKTHAKIWAAALASVYEQPSAIAAQRDFTVPRLRAFALPYARSILAQAPETNVGDAFEAAYLSFAANNPTWANTSLKNAIEGDAGEPTWTVSWLALVLKHLTFDPKVAIYPHRYNAIRPVLEKLYGMDLPDFATELQQAGGENWLDTKTTQQLLVDLGYDLGPSGPNGDGVDGNWGRKSQTALAAFQKKHGLPDDGWPDPDTNEELLRARDTIERIKADNGGTIPPELKLHVEALVALTAESALTAYFATRGEP